MSIKKREFLFSKLIKKYLINFITLSWFHSSDDYDGTIEQGVLNSYHLKGYSINLGLTKAQSIEILNDLKQNKWLDLNTRLLIIDFTAYNGNINLFAQIKYQLYRCQS